MKSQSLRMALGRLQTRRVVKRICRGFYANPFNTPTLEEISAEIYKPSYISLESALYRHGILSQFPFTLTCVTTRLPRKFKTTFGAIEYRQVSKNRFFGFVRKDSYFQAEPEKALADFLYLNKRRELKGQLSEFKMEKVNPRRLRRYLRKMGIPTPTLPAL